MLCYVTSVVLDSVWPHRRQPTRLPRPWDSPGKNTGVGYHFLLQCMKMTRESEVTRSCLTLSDPKDCSLPGSSVHGIFQARVLEWGAIALCKLFVGLQILCRDSQNFSVAFPCTSKEHICAGCCHFSPSCIQAQLHYCGNVIKMSCHFYLNRKH